MSFVNVVKESSDSYLQFFAVTVAFRNCCRYGHLHNTFTNKVNLSKYINEKELSEEYAYLTTHGHVILWHKKGNHLAMVLFTKGNRSWYYSHLRKMDTNVYDIKVSWGY